MSLKCRVEYAGACCHVIKHGNYRAWDFSEDGARDAFEACLAETEERWDIPVSFPLNPQADVPPEGKK